MLVDEQGSQLTSHRAVLGILFILRCISDGRTVGTLPGLHRDIFVDVL